MIEHIKVSKMDSVNFKYELEPSRDYAFIDMKSFMQAAS